jgi:hypothetical protein
MTTPTPTEVHEQLLLDVIGQLVGNRPGYPVFRWQVCEAVAGAINEADMGWAMLRLVRKGRLASIRTEMGLGRVRTYWLPYSV